MPQLAAKAFSLSAALLPERLCWPPLPTLRPWEPDLRLRAPADADAEAGDAIPGWGHCRGLCSGGELLGARGEVESRPSALDGLLGPCAGCLEGWVRTWGVGSAVACAGVCTAPGALPCAKTRRVSCCAVVVWVQCCLTVAHELAAQKLAASQAGSHMELSWRACMWTQAAASICCSSQPADRLTCVPGAVSVETAPSALPVGLWLSPDVRDEACSSSRTLPGICIRHAGLVRTELHGLMEQLAARLSTSGLHCSAAGISGLHR